METEHSVEEVDAASPQPPAAHGLIDRARQRLGLSTRELWIACVASGANIRLDDLTAFLGGVRSLPRSDYDALAGTLNDMFRDAGVDRSVPYSEDWREPGS